jgi:hypothetical protein
MKPSQTLADVIDKRGDLFRLEGRLAALLNHLEQRAEVSALNIIEEERDLMTLARRERARIA